jgi:hypothetical protein
LTGAAVATRILVALAVRERALLERRLAERRQGRCLIIALAADEPHAPLTDPEEPRPDERFH